MDTVERLRGADPINDEFDVGYDEPFEQMWLRAEQVGRVVMVLFIAAGLAGLPGRGPLESDVMAAVRQSGPMRLEQRRYAVVERDGKVSIVPGSGNES